MKKLLFALLGISLFVTAIFTFSTEIVYTYQVSHGAFKKIVDENGDGKADKVYTQQCFGNVPDGLWAVTVPTKEEQVLFFRNRILAIR